MNTRLRRALPHTWAALGIAVILPTVPTLWFAAPLPAVIAAFGVLMLSVGYLVRSGAVYVVEIERDELERAVADDQLFRELATGELPYIGDEPRGRHAS